MENVENASDAPLEVETDSVLKMINEQKEIKKENNDRIKDEDFKCGIPELTSESTAHYNLNVLNENSSTDIESCENGEHETDGSSRKREHSEDIDFFPKRLKNPEFIKRIKGSLKIEDPLRQVIVTCKGLPNDEFTDCLVVEFLTAVGNFILNTHKIDTAPPQFDPIMYDQKHLLVTAMNHSSRKWLLRELRSIKPWGDTVQLFSFDPTRKFVVVVPQKTYQADQEILDLLDIQNPGLCWSQRKVWERIEKPCRVGIIFLMDDRSMDKPGSMSPSPFYSCSRGRFGLFLGKTTEQPLFLT